MTSTDLHNRSRVQGERRPTKGAARIDAILAVIDRGLDEATPASRCRPDCEHLCTIGRSSREVTPPTVAELTVHDSPGRRPMTADAPHGLALGPSARKEVA
jgi:hypothetical protein